jgi:hypothetical protein
MSTFKTLLLFLFGGAVVGEALGSVLGRSAIPWYYTPGHGQLVQSQFPETAQAIIGDLLRFQIIGAAIGAVGFLIIGIVATRAASQRQTTSSPPPPTP